MADAVVQIQARLGSTRLPGKVLFHLADRRVIDWVVQRCRDATIPKDVVVAIGDRPENDAIEEWCERAGVYSVRGPEEDLLARHMEVSDEVDADTIIRVTGDCPFIPPSEIDRVLSEHRANDSRYTTNVTDEMPVGTAVDVVDRDLLEDLAALGDTHPVKRLRESPDDWGVSISPNKEWMQYSRAHVAVDTPSDYWRLTDAMEAVGANPVDVTRWLDQQ